MLQTSTHPTEEKIYTTRADRARQIIDAGLIQPIDSARGLYSVQSQSCADVSYLVDVSNTTCECPDALRHICKHLLAAQRCDALLERSKHSEWCEMIDD